MNDYRRERWEEAKAKQWPVEGREQRIAQSLSALDAAIMDYGLDTATVHWIAGDVDAEDM